jgi:hypothetical protein
MASQHDSLAGDILEIEHTDDYTASTVSWTLIGRTADTIEESGNVEVADRRHHGSELLDKAATSEAPELSFSRDVTMTPGAMEALGLLDTSTYEQNYTHDSRTATATAEALQITAYENEAQRSNSTVKYQLGIDSYIINLDSKEFNVDDFSTMELIVHALTRPIRLDQGGSLGSH